MLRLYKKLEDIWFVLPEKLRFLLVGGFNTVFSYGLFAFMVAFLTISYHIALGVSYIISVNVTIFTQRYYVFRSHGNFLQEYSKSWIVYLLILLINYIFMYITVDILGLNELIAQAVYTVGITIFTYFMHKYFSFAKHYPAK